MTGGITEGKAAPLRVISTKLGRARAVAGDHQPPPVPGRQRGDRRRHDLQVIGQGVGPHAAGPQRGGQRLTGVVTPAAQRVQPEQVEIGARRRPFSERKVLSSQFRSTFNRRRAAQPLTPMKSQG